MSYIKPYKEFHKVNENTQTSEYEVEIKSGNKIVDKAVISKETAIKIQDILDSVRGTQVMDPVKDLVSKQIDLNEAQEYTVDQAKDRVQKILNEDHVIFGNETLGIHGHAKKELCFNVANTSFPYKIKIYHGYSKTPMLEQEHPNVEAAVKNYNAIDLEKYKKTK